MPSITVALHPPYEIVIEPRAIERLGESVRSVAPSARAMLIADANVASLHGDRARASLESAGYSVHCAQIIAEESHKTLETVKSLYEAMLGAGLDRTSPVIAMGGGIVGDVAGLAAATFMRGLPLVHVPTTLLAMVDAAIGGKTGVNWLVAIDSRLSATESVADSRQPTAASPLLKNIIGAFHQPRMVIIDPETLRTLDPRELRCGLAECIKHAVIADADLFSFLRGNMEKILALDKEVLTTLIERSARIKASIVAEDEREVGARALLNLGHTFGHAIESMHELNLKHGEAVAIGLCAAAYTAVLTKRLAGAEAREIESLIEYAGLPLRILHRADAAFLINAMGYDKKIAHGKLRLILPNRIGSAEIVSDVPREIIEAAWRHAGASG